ncbi:MAG: hypothetical protein VKM92_00975 [Cyanobacteriota bacterium]|nr:hypothetical protein [Cyanobacteriota bacterium]
MSLNAQPPAMMRQLTPTTDACRGESQAAEPGPGDCQQAADPVLCNHCGRTASNGISCIGACVADSGY